MIRIMAEAGLAGGLSANRKAIQKPACGRLLPISQHTGRDLEAKRAVNEYGLDARFEGRTDNFRLARDRVSIGRDRSRSLPDEAQRRWSRDSARQV
jgi:hypothetical protein